MHNPLEYSSDKRRILRDYVDRFTALRIQYTVDSGYNEPVFTENLLYAYTEPNTTEPIFL